MKFKWRDRKPKHCARCNDRLTTKEIKNKKMLCEPCKYQLERMKDLEKTYGNIIDKGEIYGK